MTTQTHTRTRSALSRRGVAHALRPVLLTSVLLLLLTAGPAAADVVRLDPELAAARAVEVSDLIGAAAARVEAAEATVRQADAGAWPVVRSTVSAARRSSVPEYSVPIAGPDQPGLVLMPDITTTAAASLGVEQALYAGGAVTSGRQAARHERGSAAATAAATLADVRLEARLAYWNAVNAAAVVELAQARVRRTERLGEDTRALLEAGMAVRADVLAAEERAATARFELVTAEATAGIASERLRSLLHCSADEELQPEDTLLGRLPGGPAPLDELVAFAVERRPELEAARARVAAFGARQAQARAAGRPRLAASAQYETARPNSRYFPLADEWNESWSVGLFGSWTLFDGGSWRSRVATVEAEQRAAEAELDELERRVKVEIVARRRELEAALAAAPAADAARAAGAAREEASRERYAAGLATTVEILDAQELLAAAELRQVSARGQAFVAAAYLERAVGR